MTAGTAPSVVQLLLAADGLLTVVASVLAVPIGVSLILLNVVAAVASRQHRRAFLAVAIAGAIVVAFVALFSFAAHSSSVEVGPASPLRVPARGR